MRSANEYLRDEAIRHALHLEKYGKGLARTYVELLNSADDELVGKIAARLATADLKGFDPGPASTKRFQDMLTEVRALNSAVYQKAANGLKADLTELTQYEADFAKHSLSAATGAILPINLPPATYLAALVENSPIDGHLLKSWTDHMDSARMARVEQQIRLGLLQGEGMDSIVNRVRGTKAAQYADGALNVSRNSGQAFVLTANSTVAHSARDAVYQRNSRLVKSLQWVSTLDSRTSPVCQMLDRKIFAIGEPHPTPPKHLRCRSLLSPITKSFDEMGVPKADVSPAKRASMDGAVAGDTDFGGWIMRQSPERQDAVFGPGRAEMLRKGEVSFKDLFKESGEYRTLDELRRSEGFGTAKPAAPKPSPKPEGPKPQPKSVPEPVAPKAGPIDADAHNEASREYVLDKGRATGNEHLVAFDTKTGADVQRNMGARSSVQLTDALVRKISDPTSSVVVHHNHPSSSSFSKQDIDLLQKFPGMDSIWAHGHNGSAFYAKVGKRKLTGASYRAINESVVGALQNAVNARFIQPEEASIISHHIVWTAIGDLEMLDYKADLAGESLAVWEKYKALFTRILESLK